MTGKEVYDLIAFAKPCRVCDKIQHEGDAKEITCRGFPSAGDVLYLASWAAFGEPVGGEGLVAAARQIELLQEEVERLKDGLEVERLHATLAEKK